ncbi:hypothetical protein ACIRST_38480 [Kitasatospora sp. NPDC101447]|uniref:hypothetical protein n=1 Tax=Kitasatospora sp. NPDC101447 TaxID=3364102 RepID=UPI0037FBBF2C
MADQPIEPTNVVLSGERPTTPPPPPPSEPPTVGGPDAFLPPLRRGSEPPPAGAGTPPPPPPSGPPPASGGLPEPGEWWRRPGGGRGGGVATAPAPVYAPPAEVHHHHYYPAAPAPAAPGPAAARFEIRRIRPVANGLAAATGVVLAKGPVNEFFHLFTDPMGLPVLGLAVAAVLEWRWHRYQVWWPVRVFTCTMISSLVITPAGQQLIGYLMTGATG